MYHPHSLFGIAYTLITLHADIRHALFIHWRRRHRLFAASPAHHVLVGLHLRLCAVYEAQSDAGYPYNGLMLQVGGIAEMFYGTECEQIILRSALAFVSSLCRRAAAWCRATSLVQRDVHAIIGPDSLLADLLRHADVVSCGTADGASRLVWCRIRCRIYCPWYADRGGEGRAAELCAIEALHAEYVDEIRALFDRHKGKMGAEWVKARGEKLYLEDEAPSSSSKKVD